MEHANLLTPEEMKRNMFARFGTNAHWAEVKVYVTFSELVEQYGDACEEYHPLCACCRAHIEWQTTGKVTFSISRKDALEVINR